MPSYSAGTPIGLYPGDSVALVNNAATEANVTDTQAVAIAPIPGAERVIITNTTNQACTVYAAASDYPGSVNNYKALTDGDTGTAATVASGATGQFTVAGGFLLGHFASAPTSGSLIIAR